MVGAYPGELDPHLVAWDKVRRRFVGLTKQLGDVRLADADSQSRDLFRKLVRETIADIWKHTGREARGASGHRCAETIRRRLVARPHASFPVRLRISRAPP